MGREPSFFHQANAECEIGLGSECHSNFHQSKFSNGPLPPMNLTYRSWTPFAPLTEHDCVPRLSKAAVILILRVPINQRDTGCDMLIVTGGCSIERTGPPAPMPSAAQLLKLKACIEEERRPGAGWQFEFRLVVLWFLLARCSSVCGCQAVPGLICAPASVTSDVAVNPGACNRHSTVKKHP